MSPSLQIVYPQISLLAVGWFFGFTNSTLRRVIPRENKGTVPYTDYELSSWNTSLAKVVWRQIERSIVIILLGYAAECYVMLAWRTAVIQFLFSFFFFFFSWVEQYSVDLCNVILHLALLIFRIRPRQPRSLMYALHCCDWLINSPNCLIGIWTQEYLEIPSSLRDCKTRWPEKL